MRLSALLGCLAAFVIAVAAPAQQTRVTPASAEQIKLSFAPVVRAAAPAVVYVYSERVVRASPYDEMFGRFFGRERLARSLGSGVIVRSDGIVVTNNHVVAGADELRVTLADRRELPAKLVLADERTDLAILRIDTKGEKLPTLPFDEDGDTQVGDVVLAIGNPFGIGQTVTQGIVSALGRSDVGVNDYAFFIQTDAAINPGNSGGALVDLDGELIGINTAIFSRSGGSEGVGFAIPAALVERVVEGALSEGRIVRPWLGAQGQPVDQGIASSLGLDRPRGVLIGTVYPKGPAAQAGVRVGDVVLTVDGQEVDTESALRFRLATHKVGEHADVVIWRDGRERKLDLLAAAPPETPARDVRTLEGRNPLAGAEVANMSPAFNEEKGLDPYLEGVVVTSAGGDAGYNGFRAGDVIEAVNGKAVGTTRELAAAVAAADGSRAWSFVINRNGQRFQQTLRF